MAPTAERRLWRGHRLVRHADDVRVFVRSERAARRVLASVTAVVEQRLKLRVTREKPKAVHARSAVLLGFGSPSPGVAGAAARADPKAVRRLKDRLRELTSRRWSIAMDERIERISRFTTGWMGCFQLRSAW